jgi:hypothetical protein
MDSTKAVQGVAVYAEFVRTNATTQVIVTPRGFTDNDTQTTAFVVRRTVTAENPRKQWKFSSLYAKSGSETTPPLGYPSELSMWMEDRADSMMRYAQTLFDQLMRGAWTLAGEPILVEVSKEDLGLIAAGKAPTKMLYRIGLCRTAGGYPENIVNEIPAPILVP